MEEAITSNGLAITDYHYLQGLHIPVICTIRLLIQDSSQ